MGVIACYKLNVTKIAKETALSMIQQYSITDTQGELGFWLHIPAQSDFIAMAVFIDNAFKSHDTVTDEDIYTMLEKSVPPHFFDRCINSAIPDDDLPF